MPNPTEPARTPTTPSLPASPPAAPSPGTSSPRETMPQPPDDDGPNMTPLGPGLNDGELLPDSTEPIENEIAPHSDMRRHWH